MADNNSKLIDTLVNKINNIDVVEYNSLTTDENSILVYIEQTTHWRDCAALDEEIREIAANAADYVDKHIVVKDYAMSSNDNFYVWKITIED